MGPGPPPLPAECFGPYDPREHILRAQEIDALRLSVTSREFFEPERLGSLDLINELALSFLERTFLRSRTVPAAAETLFPHRGESQHLDNFSYRHFTQPHADPIPNFDSASVCSRIQSFLASRDPSVVFGGEYIAGISGVMAYLLAEVVCAASNHASDVFRDYILPCDVRCVVISDQQLRDRLQFSKSFWEGRHRELPLAETRSESYVTEEEHFPTMANIDYEE
ncbi:hypothetical protein N7532_011823 [Penicillium argentinense]|uniref:Uncharacterized protein n=1 Tax=Penicillium argentinense TaxID=1131581 RepID=A0A9W9EJB2_9EURO|nr:uncharacterized protein N7532_011823 [Penicillium argentinense]KAJ5082780.1 hypothetical protein N7532_011823 [Penicillium argentinense]